MTNEEKIRLINWLKDIQDHIGTHIEALRDLETKEIEHKDECITDTRTTLSFAMHLKGLIHHLNSQVDYSGLTLARFFDIEDFVNNDYS